MKKTKINTVVGAIAIAMSATSAMAEDIVVGVLSNVSAYGTN